MFAKLHLVLLLLSILTFTNIGVAVPAHTMSDFLSDIKDSGVEITQEFKNIFACFNKTAEYLPGSKAFNHAVG
jgi:hypothetical protein